MAVARTPGLTVEQRRALALIADSGMNGATEAILIANGFTVDLLADRVRAGLAIATPQRVRAGDQMIELTRLRITDAGRRAVDVPT
jgi:hypothetical protein